MTTKWPLTTGEAGRLIGVSECTLSNQIRLGRVQPPLLCGRRAWYAEHVLAVARILGKETAELQNTCNVEAHP
jgi:hypothetical protein